MTTETIEPIRKLYKRCKRGRHADCPGSFEAHSVCECDCHAGMQPAEVVEAAQAIVTAPVERTEGEARAKLRKFAAKRAKAAADFKPEPDGTYVNHPPSSEYMPIPAWPKRNAPHNAKGGRKATAPAVRKRTPEIEAALDHNYRVFTDAGFGRLPDISSKLAPKCSTGHRVHRTRDNDSTPWQADVTNGVCFDCRARRIKDKQCEWCGELEGFECACKGKLVDGAIVPADPKAKAKRLAKPNLASLSWHSDPGHAWLKVPLASARAVPEISSFSYMDKTHAYLEEDCDAGRFMAHWGFTMTEINTVPTVNTDNDSPIRRKASFA